MLTIVNVQADLLDHSRQIVNYYYANEEDIRKICEPHWAITLNQSQAEENAAREIAVHLPIDAFTAHLLAGMWFENHSK